MKAQFLVDFLTQLLTHKGNRDWWLLSVDSSSNKKGSGAGVINLKIEQAIRFSFSTSNNQVKYEALIVGLRLAKELGVRHLKC